MKTIRTLAVLLLLIIPVIASAQDNKFLRPSKVITEIQNNEGESGIAVLSLPENDQEHYYLSVGRLGHGDEVIQVHIDPVSVLYIKLGDTLEEAQAKLEEIQAVGKKPVNTSAEVLGILAVGFPTEEAETVTVTHRRPILEHVLEFSVSRDGYIRATYIPRSNLGSVVSGVKFYRKIHPEEK